jgi:hypothetical protein
MTVQETSPAARRSESGSAYLATMLVLVVLTILGLSLAVITQTEVLISGSEKQAVRQLFAASSGVQAAAAYELVSRDSASHRMRIGQRSEDILGQTTVIGDDLCTTPFLQLSTTNCNLCKVNEGDYFAVGYGITAAALRRGDSDLGARKSVGSMVTFEPWQANPTNYQLAGDAPLKTPDDPTVDVDPATEVDPCEGIYLKI